MSHSLWIVGRSATAGGRSTGRMFTINRPDPRFLYASVPGSVCRVFRAPVVTYLRSGVKGNTQNKFGLEITVSIVKLDFSQLTVLIVTLS